MLHREAPFSPAVRREASPLQITVYYHFGGMVGGCRGTLRNLRSGSQSSVDRRGRGIGEAVISAIRHDSGQTPSTSRSGPHRPSECSAGHTATSKRAGGLESPGRRGSAQTPGYAAGALQMQASESLPATERDRATTSVGGGAAFETQPGPSLVHPGERRPASVSLCHPIDVV